MKNALSAALILLGVTFLICAILLIYIRNYSNALAFEKAPEASFSNVEKTPVKLTIPSISKTLNIYPGVITANRWETTEKGVSFLATSPVPGEIGNSILYGHNWHTILGDLYKIKPGEVIIIEFNNGEALSFVVENTAVVNPSKISVIENTTDKRITLFTCSGFLDTKRLVVVAKPI